MNDVDLDLDAQMSRLESEWNEVYEASITARCHYQALAANKSIRAEHLDTAREEMERAEEQKARTMTKIERLEVLALR